MSVVRVVQVGAADVPAGGEILHRVVLHVPLHGDQAAAELQAHRAPVGRRPVVSAEVLDHGRVVPRTLAAEAALERLLSWKRGQESVQKAGRGRQTNGFNLPARVNIYFEVQKKICLEERTKIQRNQEVELPPGKHMETSLPPKVLK